QARSRSQQKPPPGWTPVIGAAVRGATAGVVSVAIPLRIAERRRPVYPCDGPSTELPPVSRDTPTHELDARERKRSSTADLIGTGVGRLTGGPITSSAGP